MLLVTSGGNGASHCGALRKAHYTFPHELQPSQGPTRNQESPAPGHPAVKWQRKDQKPVLMALPPPMPIPPLGQPRLLGASPKSPSEQGGPPEEAAAPSDLPGPSHLQELCVLTDPQSAARAAQDGPPAPR